MNTFEHNISMSQKLMLVTLILDYTLRKYILIYLSNERRDNMKFNQNKLRSLF